MSIGSDLVVIWLSFNCHSIVIQLSLRGTRPRKRSAQNDMIMKITNDKIQISNKYQNRNFKAQRATIMF